MMNSKTVAAIIAWCRQSTTIHGLAIASAVLSAALSGKLPWSLAGFGFVAAAIMIAMPQDTVATALASMLVAEVPAAVLPPAAVPGPPSTGS